jgi:hypothetical protein
MDACDSRRRLLKHVGTAGVALSSVSTSGRSSGRLCGAELVEVPFTAMSEPGSSLKYGLYDDFDEHGCLQHDSGEQLAQAG